MKPSAVILLVLSAVTALVLVVVNQEKDTPVEGVEVSMQPTQGGSNFDTDLPTDLNSTRTTAPTTDGTQAAAEETMDGELAPYENELVGSVRNEGGDAVEEAVVILSRRPLQAMAFVNDPVDRSGDIRSVTKSDGTFRFLHIEAYESYTLIVDHSEYSRKEVGNVRVGVSGTFEEPPITLTQGARLSGLISDTGSNPVPGATIHLDGMLAGLGNQPSSDRMTTQSDNLGRYEFQNCPTGQRTLLVSADGYGSVLIAGVKIIGAKDYERDVTLEVAEMICGRVIDSNNTPVEDADVVALSYSTGNTQCRDFTQTDVDGQFCLEHLNSGQYTIAVSAKGYGPQRKTRVTTGSTGLVLELSAQATVSGRVISKETGKPLVNFTCVLRMAYENTDVTSPTRVSDDFRSPSGEFTLTGVDRGYYVVEAFSQGYASSFSPRFSVTKGQTLSGIVVEVGKGGTLMGRILGSDGKPIQGALVSTHDNDWTDDPFTRALGAEYPTNATTKKRSTNQNGRFKISGLSPANYQIRIQAPGYSRLVRTNVLISESRETDLGSVRLEAGGGVSGLVVDQAGQPIVSARVTLLLDGRTGSIFEPRETKSSSKGKYSFANIPPGNYKIKAMRADPSNDVFGGIVDQQRSEQRVSIREGQVAKIDMRIGGGSSRIRKDSGSRTRKEK